MIWPHVAMRVPLQKKILCMCWYREAFKRNHTSNCRHIWKHHGHRLLRYMAIVHVRQAVQNTYNNTCKWNKQLNNGEALWKKKNSFSGKKKNDWQKTTWAVCWLTHAHVINISYIYAAVLTCVRMKRDERQPLPPPPFGEPWTTIVQTREKCCHKRAWNKRLWRAAKW